MVSIKDPMERKENGFDSGRKLSPRVSQKCLEYGKYFRFGTEKIHPCKPIMTAYECHNVLEMNMRNNW